MFATCTSWLSLCCADDDTLSITALPFQRPCWSYTVDTLLDHQTGTAQDAQTAALLATAPSHK